MSAFRLAFPLGDGTYGASRHPFVTPEAARKAAARLNIVRGARDLAPYTHVAEYDGTTFVELTELQAEANQHFEDAPSELNAAQIDEARRRRP